MTTNSSIITMKDGVLQPITMTMLKGNPYYNYLKNGGGMKPYQVITYTIKHYLLKYWEEDINKADYGDKPIDPRYRRVSEEGDILDDICYVQSVAIARVNKLVGPRCNFGLYHRKTTAERLGINFGPVKKWPSLNTLPEEYVDKVYNLAVQKIKDYQEQQSQ